MSDEDSMTIRELLKQWGNPITRDEILAEKAAIEADFVALGMTVEEGEDRVRRHAYQHDDGPFDRLAERYIENQAWLRVSEKPERCDHGVDLDDDCYTCGPADMIGAVRMWREAVGHDPGDEDRQP